MLKLKFKVNSKLFVLKGNVSSNCAEKYLSCKSFSEILGLTLFHNEGSVYERELCSVVFLDGIKFEIVWKKITFFKQSVSIIQRSFSS